MRPSGDDVVLDHDLLTDVGEDDHHPSAVLERFAVNALSISPGDYEYRVDLGKSGCQTVRGVLRGVANIDVQGHEGCFFIGSATTGQGAAVNVRPYPSGTNSYCGSYSRLYGDTLLSYVGAYGTSIALKDAYIDGDDAVLLFSNLSGSNQNLRVYGSLIAK